MFRIARRPAVRQRDGAVSTVRRGSGATESPTPEGAGLGTWHSGESESLPYFLRRRTRARPPRPLASSIIVLGSGTGGGSDSKSEKKFSWNAESTV